MRKIIYQTDADGLFIGTTEARESPLELGVILIPAGCVEIAPPDPEAGKAAVWSGDAWQLVADHRGETWYAGRDPVVIDFVGDPAERGYSAEAPEPEPDPLQPLTARQLRLGLLKLGIKPSQVDAAIDTLPDDQRETAQIEWEYATVYQRDHTLLALLASAFGLSDATVDAAWREAEAL